MDGVIIRMKAKQKLKECLQRERDVYFGGQKIRFDYIYRKTMKYEIYRYISLLRKYEYYCDMRDYSKNVIASKYWALKVKVCDRRKNKLGMQLGLEITPGYVGSGVRICHQNVIINGYVGENCIFHGNNVIGNKRTGAAKEIPRIGRNVDIGVGAMVIGNVTIADDCIIGAGAVVTKSFTNPGTIIAGVPAKAIRNKV